MTRPDTTAPVRIVGGGMTGLTLGFLLAQRGIRVCVHERLPYLGGLASEGMLDGVPVERFYHCVLPTDTSLLSLFTELGIHESVAWTRTRTGFFHAGQLLEMTTTRDFLTFPALRLLDRIRLGWTIAYCKALPSWRRLDAEPISPFLRRHGGERLFRAIWEPLLLSKLGPRYDRFAASFIWATVARMLSARTAQGRSEHLGYVSGRYGRVFMALRRAIEQAGGSVVAGEQVDAVRALPEGSPLRWSLRAGAVEYPATGVILTVPTPIAIALLADTGVRIPTHVADTEYLGVLCEALLLRRSLTPYYVLNLTDRRLPFTGVIEFTNLTGTGEFQGRHLAYLPRYRDRDSAEWGRSDTDLHRENIEALRLIVPDLQDADILAWEIHRARHVQPVHPPGWGSRLPPVALAPGLAFVSTAQIHPWPVFNDEVVRLTRSLLPSVLGVLGHPHP